jgi:ubiquinone biosynthesis protein
MSDDHRGSLRLAGRLRIMTREGVVRRSSTRARAAAGLPRSAGVSRSCSTSAARAAADARGCRCPHPPRAHLCQARPVPGDAARRRRADIARDLASLQDKHADLPAALADRTRSRRSLGRRSASSLSSFGEPVAAASIAQVHKAEVRERDGRA